GAEEASAARVIGVLAEDLDAAGHEEAVLAGAEALEERFLARRLGRRQAGRDQPIESRHSRTSIPFSRSATEATSAREERSRTPARQGTARNFWPRTVTA